MTPTRRSRGQTSIGELSSMELAVVEPVAADAEQSIKRREFIVPLGRQPRVGSVFHPTPKCPNLMSSRSVGYDDAIPRKKICPCAGTHWACDGRSGKRIVCRHPCGVQHRGVHFPGFYSHHDACWRNRVLPGDCYSLSGFSGTK